MTPGKKSTKNRLVELFSSLRLAIALLIVLALVSIFGTFIPQEQDPAVYAQRYGADYYSLFKNLGLIDLYHSWGFRLLMGLITLNLLVCTLRRFKGVYRRTVAPDTEKSAESIGLLKINNVLPAPSHVPVLERALGDKGYRVVKRGRFIYGGKGVIGIWGDMVTHLSILLVIAGALVGSAGFVSTVNVYVGGYTDVAYNWSTGRDEPLGFRLNVENFNLKYYPVETTLSVRRISTGEKLGVLNTREGGVVDIPGTNLSASPTSVDMARREALLKLYDNGRLIGLYDTGLKSGGPAAPPAFDYALFLDAAGPRELMSVAGTVSLARDGTPVKKGLVAVNNPLRFEGISIYQTSFGKDPEGREYTGFQIVRDPGLPLVWSGFALLLVGLFLSFYYSFRQVWVYAGDDRIFIGGTTNKNWGAFMTEYGGLIKSFMQEIEP